MAIARVHAYERLGRRWRQTSSPSYQFSPATWVVAAAFAAKRPRGRPGPLTTVTEAALLLQHLEHALGADLTWTRAASAAPPHLSRFLTEAAALALAVEMGRVVAWDPTVHDLYNVDDLPTAMSWLRPSDAGRPDFVFETPSGLRATEARGRSTAGPGSTRPVTTQQDKIRVLDLWAAAVQAPAAPRAARPAGGRRRPMAWPMT